MSGMIFLVICTCAGAGDGGWQSTRYPAGGSSAAPTGGAPATRTSNPPWGAATSRDVRPASAEEPWPQVNQALDRAEQAVRDEVGGFLDDASRAVRTQLSGNTPLPTAATGGSRWPEVEAALRQTAIGPSTSTLQGPGGRMRRGSVTTPPPSPPLQLATTTSPATRGNNVSAATARDLPSRGDLDQWLDQQDLASTPFETGHTDPPGTRPQGRYAQDVTSPPEVATGQRGPESPRWPRNSLPSTSYTQQDPYPPATNSTAPDPDDYERAETEFDRTDPYRQWPDRLAQRNEQSSRAAPPAQEANPFNARRAEQIRRQTMASNTTTNQAEPRGQLPIGNRQSAAAANVAPPAEDSDRQYIRRPSRDDLAAPDDYSLPSPQEDWPTYVQRPVGPGETSQAPSVTTPPSANDTSGTSGPPAANTVDAVPHAATTSEHPWWPLMLAVLGLFGSIGFNLYLGWIAWDLYSRYQDTLEDVHELEGKLEAAQREQEPPLAPLRPSTRRSIASAG